jgi:hypothetical protein
MINYPVELPVEAVQSLIEMIRTKSIDKARFGHCLWNVQGYAQSKILGSTFQIYGSSQEVTDEDMITALESLQQDNQMDLNISQMNPAFSIILKWALSKALEYLF